MGCLAVSLLTTPCGNTRCPCEPHLARDSYLSLIVISFSDVTSEESVITFNVYDRSVDDAGFLGTVKVKPVLIHDHTVDEWYK
jgi:hypothetical protein